MFSKKLSVRLVTATVASIGFGLLATDALTADQTQVKPAIWNGPSPSQFHELHSLHRNYNDLAYRGSQFERYERRHAYPYRGFHHLRHDVYLSYGYGFHGSHGFHRYGGYPYYSSFYDVGSETYGQIQIKVKPKKAEVFVDGAHAGMVDDFDGGSQKLRVYPGKHDIVIWYEGYKTLQMRIFVGAGRTYKVENKLVALAEGDVQERKPEGPVLDYDDRTSPHVEGPYHTRRQGPQPAP